MVAWSQNMKIYFLMPSQFKLGNVQYALKLSYVVINIINASILTFKTCLILNIEFIDVKF